MFCPYCAGAGCEWCDGTGDLIGKWIGDAYGLGRQAGVEKMRQVYQVLVLAGKQVSGDDAPADLKRRLTGRP